MRIPHPGPDREIRADRQLGAEPRVVLPLGEVPGRGVRHRMHRIIPALISPTVVTVTTPLSVLPYRPGHCRPTCAVFVPSLRSPLSSITSTPPPCGAVAGSARSSSSRRAFTAPGSHTDSDKKNCSRCTAGSFDPVTGSAPARAVSVLLHSRGASSPARYSRNPRRCATCVNRSSKPGRVLFQRTRGRRTRYRLRHHSSPAPKKAPENPSLSYR